MGPTKLELRDRKIQKLDQRLRVVEWDRPEVTFHAGALHFKWHDRLVLATTRPAPATPRGVTVTGGPAATR